MQGVPNQPPPLVRSARRRRRNRFWIAFPFLLVGLVTLSGLAFRWNNERAIRRLENRIRERGEPLNLAELAKSQPVVPASENAASFLIHLWKADDPEYWAAFLEHRQPLTKRRSVPYDPNLPFLGDGRDWLKSGRRDPLTAEQRCAAEAFVRKNRERFEKVQEALATRSGVLFPVVVTNGFAALMPHLAEMRTEARSARIGALLAVDEGRIEDAILYLEGMARIGHALRREPFVISHLVRMAIDGMILDEMERLVTRHRPALGDLRRLTSLVDRLWLTNSLRDSFLGERAMQMSLFDDTQEFLRVSDMTEADTRVLRPMFAVFKVFGIVSADRRFCLEIMEDTIHLAEQQTPEALVQSELLLNTISERTRSFPPKLICSFLLSGVRGMPPRFARAEARRRAALVALAVEHFRVANGDRLPTTISDLVPAHLAGAPVDPFTGHALHLKRLPKGYVVYSVGVDRVDDSGRERLKDAKTDNFDETFVVER